MRPRTRKTASPGGCYATRGLPQPSRYGDASRLGAGDAGAGAGAGEGVSTTVSTGGVDMAGSGATDGGLALDAGSVASVADGDPCMIVVRGSEW